MTLVDSSVWIDALRGTPTVQVEWLKRHLLSGKVTLTDLILCEVLQGVSTAKEFAAVQSRLRAFPLLLAGGEELGVAAADNYRELRKRGKTIRSTIDCLTATLCILGGHSLLHGDRDFDAFEQHLGLQVIHPSTH